MEELQKSFLYKIFMLFYIPFMISIPPAYVN